MDPIMRDDFVPRRNQRFDVFIRCQRQNHGNFVEVDLKLKSCVTEKFCSKRTKCGRPCVHDKELC